MPTDKAPKRSYQKPEVRELGSIAAITKNMVMGSVADGGGMLMMIM